MEMILEKLKCCKNRSSTSKNYHRIWRNFNNFIIKLDRKPNTWEKRMSLYGAFLVDAGIQSSTLKSYKSAIKCVLVTDGYSWNDDKVLLNSLIKACKLVNDRVRTRLPIQIGLLEMILFETQRKFCHQEYAEYMYKAIFSLGYYGLLRIGELVQGFHTVKAKDVHMGENKNKIR